MKRGKRILKMVWEDLWVGLGLVLVLCAAQFFRSSQWNLERLKELTGSSFPGSLILVSAVTLTLMIYSRYSVYEPLKIFMGYTRKNVFWDMQLVKLLSAFFCSSHFRRGSCAWRMAFGSMGGSESGFLGICADAADTGSGGAADHPLSEDQETVDRTDRHSGCMCCHRRICRL